jgi:hypothetical protein
VEDQVESINVNESKFRSFNLALTNHYISGILNCEIDNVQQRAKSCNRRSKVIQFFSFSRGVGKSSLSTVFAESKYNDQYSPTIENCYQRKLKIKGIPFTCNVIDTAGQGRDVKNLPLDQFSIFQPQYALGVEGYVLVYRYLCVSYV